MINWEFAAVLIIGCFIGALIWELCGRFMNYIVDKITDDDE